MLHPHPPLFGGINPRVKCKLPQHRIHHNIHIHDNHNNKKNSAYLSYMCSLPLKKYFFPPSYISHIKASLFFVLSHFQTLSYDMLHHCFVLWRQEPKYIFKNLIRIHSKHFWITLGNIKVCLGIICI